MTASKLLIRLDQLNLHPTTLLIMGNYYPKAITGLSLDDAIRWQAMDAWVRYKEYLANITNQRSL